MGWGNWRRSTCGLVVGVALSIMSLSLAAAGHATERHASAGLSEASGQVWPVHRRFDFHCHRRDGYRRWCQQGDRSWRSRERGYDRSYYRRRYYLRRKWQRRYMRWDDTYRRRGYWGLDDSGFDHRDQRDWRPRPYLREPRIYQAI